MPRSKSVILTPTEKKELLASLKSGKKEAKTGLKTVDSEIKAVARERKSQDKDFSKRTKVFTKELASIQNQLDKLAPKPTPNVSLTQPAA